MAKEIFTEALLWNVIDEKDTAEGKKQPLNLRCKVDNGSTYIILPETVAQELNLIRPGKIKMRYADTRESEKEVALGLRVKILDRDIVTKAITEPERETVLIGALALEEMDLIADHGQVRTSPRSEKGLVEPIE